MDVYLLINEAAGKRTIIKTWSVGCFNTCITDTINLSVKYDSKY